MQRHTIFLVEHNVGYIKRFCNYFEENYDIMTSCDEESALELYAEHNTDIHIVLLGNAAQDQSHCGLLEEIRAFCDVPVIMLMKNDEQEPQMVAYRMGADECVDEETSFPLLQMKIEAILKRVYGTDHSIREGILELDLDKRTLKVGEEYIDVTTKEFELLNFLMRNKHSVQSRDQIITSVWGINFEGSDRVVDSLVKKLRLKLKDAAKYIHTAYGMGYYFELPAEKPQGK